MSNINVSGHLFRKSIVRDMDGNIITLLDEADGGYIIRNRQVVNPVKWDEMLKREKDKIEAAKAQSMEKRDSTIPDRTVNPTVQNTLKKELDDFKEDVNKKFDAILTALNEKKSA